MSQSLSMLPPGRSESLCVCSKYSHPEVGVFGMGGSNACSHMRARAHTTAFKRCQCRQETQPSTVPLRERRVHPHPASEPRTELRNRTVFWYFPGTQSWQFAGCLLESAFVMHRTITEKMHHRHCLARLLTSKIHSASTFDLQQLRNHPRPCMHSVYHSQPDPPLPTAKGHYLTANGRNVRSVGIEAVPLKASATLVTVAASCILGMNINIQQASG